jgi:hypothetical protein
MIAFSTSGSGSRLRRAAGILLFLDSFVLASVALDSADLDSVSLSFAFHSVPALFFAILLTYCDSTFFARFVRAFFFFPSLPLPDFPEDLPEPDLPDSSSSASTSPFSSFSF